MEGPDQHRKSDGPRVTIVGHCRDEPALREHARERSFDRINRMGGNFVAIVRREDSTTLCSSASFCLNCFYAVDRGKLLHSDRLSEIARKLSTDLSLNARSAALLYSIDYAAGDGESAEDLFLASMGESLGRNNVLTLTGGLDSRLLLAGLLHLGVKPTCVTWGSEEAEDVRVARLLTERLGLEHIVVRGQEAISSAMHRTSPIERAGYSAPDTGSMR